MTHATLHITRPGILTLRVVLCGWNMPPSGLRRAPLYTHHLITYPPQARTPQPYLSCHLHHSRVRMYRPFIARHAPRRIWRERGSSHIAPSTHGDGMDDKRLLCATNYTPNAHTHTPRAPIPTAAAGAALRASAILARLHHHFSILSHRRHMVGVEGRVSVNIMLTLASGSWAVWTIVGVGTLTLTDDAFWVADGRRVRRLACLGITIATRIHHHRGTCEDAGALTCHQLSCRR